MIDSFPQYRKISNGKSYYQIDSHSRMTEIQLLGSRYSIHTIEARILPERLLISDILDDTSERFSAITKEEFETFRQWCVDSLTPLS